MFKWLWHLKNQVNGSVRGITHLLTFRDLEMKYAFDGGVLNEVQLADTLVFIAFGARALNVEEVFGDFCASLLRLAPLPRDCSCRRALEKNMGEEPSPIAPALRVAQAVRAAHHLPLMSRKHYHAFAFA
jgi:hypothetical protein